MGQTPTVIFKYACHLLTHTHTRVHKHNCTRIHMCAHSPYTHTCSCIRKPAHMACKEFIWCFLVIATKTPNLDVSRSFPRTPEWRANFKQPPPLTLQTSVLFSTPALLFFFFLCPLISEKKKRAVFYTQASFADGYLLKRGKTE